MAWTDPAGHDWATGEVVTAANMDTYIRLNLEECATDKVTTAGDIVQATGANAMARLGIGAARQKPAVNSGATALEYVQPDIGILDRDLNLVTVENTAAWTEIYSHEIAAGILGATGGARLTISGNYLNNSGADRWLQLRITLGAVIILETSQAVLSASAEWREWKLDVFFLNASAAIQKWGAAVIMGYAAADNFGFTDPHTAAIAAGAGYAQSTLDTSSAQTIVVKVRHSIANANLILKKELALLEFLPAA